MTGFDLLLSIVGGFLIGIGSVGIYACIADIRQYNYMYNCETNPISRGLCIKKVHEGYMWSFVFISLFLVGFVLFSLGWN